jgi:hypothetical protein
MRKLLLIGLLILCYTDGITQKITLSEKEELNMRDDDFMVIGNVRNLTSVYRNHQAIGEIVFYTKNLIKEKISTLTFLPASMLKIYFTATTEALSVFYVVKENRKQNVYMAKLNDDFTWSEPVLLIGSPSSSYRSSNDYFFCASEDKSKTLVYHSFSENDMTMIQAMVVDEKLSVLSNIEQSYSGQQFNMANEAAVTNDGTAFIAAGNTPNSKGNMQELILLAGLKGAATLQQYPVDLNQNAISDLQLTADNLHHNLYLSAYFSDGRYSSPRGIFMGIFDIGNQVMSSIHFTPLALQVSSSRSDLRDFKIRNVFLKKTGEMEIVAEKTFQNIRNVGGVTPVISSSLLMSTMTENARVVHEFSYDEMAIFSLKTDGSLAWSQTVLKDQTTTDDNGIFSSFGVLQHRLGNAYLFSDMSSKQFRLLAAYISANGQLTVKELQSNDEVDAYNLMPRSAVQISTSEIVMPCVSKNYLCFLKISY